MQWSPSRAERPPAVAGLFYPADPEELATLVDGLLESAGTPSAAEPPARGLIAPHAGYVYSGAVAATAWSRAGRDPGAVRRVVLLGPAHRVAFAGVAAPTQERFATPLGPVPVDTRAIAEITAIPGVRVWDAPHAEEHGLEVHLPFLREILGAEAVLVPLVVGEDSADAVEAILDRLWDDATLVVVSSDLSHYEDRDAARIHDARTATAIEEGRWRDVGPRDACGCRPLAGLLRAVRRRGLRIRTLELCNSGDTAGPPDRVVGYGAFVVERPGDSHDGAGRGAAAQG